MPLVTTEQRGHIWIMRLSRPDKLNAFNLAMLRELSDAFTAFENNSELRCAVLLADGKHFTAGLQLDEVGPAVEAGQPLFPDGQVDPLDLKEPRRSKPVLCAAHGWCITLGIELMLACDIRLAAQGTRFTQLEIKRGIFPFGGATLRFPKLAGWGNAMRWLLTGDEFDADEALRIGLIQEICPSDELEERALTIAQTICEQASLGVSETIRSSRLAIEESDAAAQAILMDQARMLMQSEDAAEGLNSFVERRKAEFKGR